MSIRLQKMKQINKFCNTAHVPKIKKKLEKSLKIRIFFFCDQFFEGGAHLKILTERIDDQISKNLSIETGSML